MSVCSFCSSTDRVHVKENYNACYSCRSVSKKCKKNTGLYFDIKTNTYIEGSELGGVGGRAVIFDLHNVADSMTPNQFCKLVTPLTETFFVCILSYVGSTTETRKDATRYINELMMLVPKLKGYLCFRRDDRASPGSKGGFISCLSSSEVHFFDDSYDHVQSARAAKAKVVQIEVNQRRAQEQLEKIVTDLLS